MNVEIDYNLPRAEAPSSGKVAVVYARYSSHNQGEQSIEGQLAAAQKYAEAKGYAIVHEYVDRAMTGRNDNRDEFQRMLSDCAKKQFQVIIVWKTDRFGRNREEITFNKYRAKKHGVRVECVAETVPDGPEGVILESVLEGMAEYYSLQLSQNIRRGNREAAKKARFTGGRVPLGYRLNESHEFVIDPNTAPLVRRIYALYAEGRTIAEIIRELNADGLHTSMGKIFTKNSLRSVLKNEKYIGIYDFKDGEVRMEDAVPAIIDKDTFYKVQELLSTNQKAPAAKWSRAEYLLSDKLFCGSCGAPMVGESGTSKTGAVYNYYLCSSHKRRNGCDRRAIRQDWIEPYVLEQATALIMDDETVRFITDGVWDYYRKQDRSREKLEGLEAQLHTCNTSADNLIRAVEAGLPFSETIKNRLSELDAQRTALETAIAETQLDGGVHLTREHIEFFLLQFRDGDVQDREWQKRLIRTFVNSIYVTDDEMILNFNFSGDRAQVKFSDFDRLRKAGVFGCRALSSTIARAAELVFFDGAFALTLKTPQR